MSQVLTYGTPPVFGEHLDATGIHFQVDVEAHLNADWSALGIFREVDLTLRLIELRVYPRQDREYTSDGGIFGPSHGWTGDTRVLEAMHSTPAIYPRLLHRVPIRGMEELAWEAVESARRRVAAGTAWADDAKAEAFANRRRTGLHAALDRLPGRLTDAQLDYLEAATIYVRLPEPSRRGVAELLTLPAKTAERTVRDRLKAARANGYLTSPGPGRRGGELTETGEALAAKYLRKDGQRRRKSTSR